MPLNLHEDCSFFGSALPEPFVLGDLETQLVAAKLLPKTAGAEGKKLAPRWDYVRKSLRALGEVGGPQRVANHVLNPLVETLGYEKLECQDEAVRTREGDEDAGWLFTGKDGARLRAWTVEMNADLDAPSKRGHAYRYSPSRVANRVLLTKGERLGLLTDGTELRLLLCDPARTESYIVINLGRGGWRSRREAPDSFRLLLALASPEGVRKLPDLTEAARLSQTKVTAKLREQAKRAVLGFLQSVFEDAKNMGVLKPENEGAYPELARRLWGEGLVVVYRLLFILKLESSPDPARAFSFASNSLWRNTYSPNFALGRIIEDYSRKGIPTGTMLSDGLRALFAMFRDGLAASGLKVSPLGGMLFGKDSTPLLDACAWTEDGVRHLLENLLWTPREGRDQPQRVHYGSLDVEDLGRVYEALLELEPGIATEPMCRLRRAKLEVVVPLAQGEAYHAAVPDAVGRGLVPRRDEQAEDDGDEEVTEEVHGGKKTKVEWIEEIHPDHFYLRVGLGRKASGAYYTPDAFVRFLVQETLEPQVAERSPKDDPNPDAILKLKVLDPAMGSGHFLVGACRFLADKLYEACRLCDELSSKAEEQAEGLSRDREGAGEKKQAELRERAIELRTRVEDLPDPNDELVRYLPSHVLEGEQSGVSQAKALAICRRLVAVHCLYGVDKNPLAVELAKMSLWLESYAEGLPLTFLDHRLVCGDSLTGPFLADLMTFPGTGQRIDDLLAKGLAQRLQLGVTRALAHVQQLEATVGKDVADVEAKRNAKRRLDGELAPFKLLAAAWSGGVMLGDADDTGYQALAAKVASEAVADDAESLVPQTGRLREMIDLGQASVAYDLAFPEISGNGFDVVLGNPPWDAIRRSNPQFFGGIEVSYLMLEGTSERARLQDEILSRPGIRARYEEYVEGFVRQDRSADRLFRCHRTEVNGNLAGRGTYDTYMLMSERAVRVMAPGGRLGMVLPGSFHLNEGATGIRRLLILENSLVSLFGFQNKRKIFDIVGNVKFDVVVGAREGTTDGIECAFYLQSPEAILVDRQRCAMKYTKAFVQSTGGEYLAFLELQGKTDAEIADITGRHSKPFGRFCESLGAKLGGELNMTYDGKCLVSVAKKLPLGEDSRDPAILGRLIKEKLCVVAEDDSFHQYDDHWTERPQYLVDPTATGKQSKWLSPCCFYRVMTRRIATVVDARSVMACIVPPGWLSACPQASRNAGVHPSWVDLALVGLMNSYSFDWLFRLRVAATVNLFLLDAVPVPGLDCVLPFVVHGALRLSCNHEGYAALWADQLGEEWREHAPKKRWPALAGEEDRWAVRAAIDAVVADAYGLSREYYEHILDSFTHKSFLDAPNRCLAAFDELKKVELKAFLKKHDPYWDVPLSQELPKPVIELAIPEQKSARGQGLLPGMGAAVESGRRSRKRA